MERILTPLQRTDGHRLEFRVYAAPDRLKAELQAKGGFKLIHRPILRALY